MMMLLRNNNRKRRKKKKKKRKTRTTTTLVSRNALSSRRTRRIKTTETTTSRSERSERKFSRKFENGINPKLMLFLWVPYLFLVTYISFVTFEKPARLVGVFKTEKRKRASEREKRETFLGESVFVRVF